MADAPLPDMTEVTHMFIPGVGKQDGTDSDILDLIKSLHQQQFKSGAYGANWEGVSLPSTPAEGTTVIRFNTDLNKKRIYSYDDTNGWEQMEF